MTGTKRGAESLRTESRESRKLAETRKIVKKDTRFLGILSFHGVKLFQVQQTRELATGTWARTVRLELDTGHSVELSLFASRDEDDIRVQKAEY